MVIELKDGDYTKTQLIETAKFLLEQKKLLEEIEETLSKFNLSKNFIFDEAIDIGYSDLTGALNAIKKELGDMEIKEGIKSKK